MLGKLSNPAVDSTSDWLGVGRVVLRLAAVGAVSLLTFARESWGAAQPAVSGADRLARWLVDYGPR